MFLISFLLVGSLAMMVARIFVPWEETPAETPLAVIPLPFRQRVRLQHINVYALSGLLILGALGHWVSTLLILIVILSMTLILLIPTNYTLYGSGISLGRTPLRRWIEFKDVELRPGRVHLIGAADWRDMDILLPTAADGEEVFSLVRRALLRQRAPNADHTPLRAKGGDSHKTSSVKA